MAGNSEKGGNLVAWNIVQQPKEKGGLGVINLRLQNDALLLKHLHKFYNKVDVPWVQLVWFRYYSTKVPHAAREVGSFWWKDVLRLNTYTALQLDAQQGMAPRFFSGTRFLKGESRIMPDGFVIINVFYNRLDSRLILDQLFAFGQMLSANSQCKSLYSLIF